MQKSMSLKYEPASISLRMLLTTVFSGGGVGTGAGGQGWQAVSGLPPPPLPTIAQQLTTLIRAQPSLHLGRFKV